jgi:hypothetical protein
LPVDTKTAILALVRAEGPNIEWYQHYRVRPASDLVAVSDISAACGDQQAALPVTDLCDDLPSSQAPGGATGGQGDCYYSDATRESKHPPGDYFTSTPAPPTHRYPLISGQSVRISSSVHSQMSSRYGNRKSLGPLQTEYADECQGRREVATVREHLVDADARVWYSRGFRSAPDVVAACAGGAWPAGLIVLGGSGEARWSAMIHVVRRLGMNPIPPYPRANPVIQAANRTT